MDLARQGLRAGPGGKDGNLTDPGQRPVHARRLVVLRRLPSRPAPKVHDAGRHAQAALPRQRIGLDSERWLSDRRSRMAEDRPGSRPRLAHNSGLGIPAKSTISQVKKTRLQSMEKQASRMGTPEVNS